MAEIEQGDVCYTFEAAIEMAAQMENEGFRSYLAALRVVKDKAAREIFKEAALDELEHKHQLEKWLVEGQMKGGGRAAAAGSYHEPGLRPGQARAASGLRRP